MAAQKICPSCMGRGMVSNPMQRTNQVCPNCSGTGTQQQQVLRVPFDYAFGGGAVVLTALQAGVASTVQIDQSADFEWIWTVASSTGLYSVQFTDASTGRTLSNAAINGENFAGTAQLPWPLVEPYLIARSGTMQGSFTDRSGAGNTIQMVLRGYKLFPVSAPMQGSSGQIVPA
jgi:hypothetical protein